MNELLSQKINLRKILTHKRDLIKKKSTIEFNVKVFEKLNKYINFKEILYIASFISIRSEISTDQLNKKIMDLGKVLSFPVIKRNSTELIFIKSNPNTNFKLDSADKFISSKFVDSNGCLSIIPGSEGLDGVFAARLIKR